MQKQFIVSHNGLEQGPFQAQDILSRLANKEFQPVDYVFIEEKQDWMILAEFQAYLDSINPTSSQLKEQPPALSPYPNVAESKKEKLLQEVQKLREQQVTSLPKEAFQSPTPEEGLPKNAMAVTLKQGEGTYSVPAEKAGQLYVKLKSSKNLSLGAQLQVKVKSGYPEKVTWEGPSKKVVGEHAQFVLLAEDQYGNFVQSYSGQMSLKWFGETLSTDTLPTKVQFKNGKAELEFTTTKSRTLSFEILASSEFPNVQLPPPAKIDFEAGPAEKLILEGPSEVMAGEAIQVKVRAVDKYGNLAKLDTEVEVEVDTKTA